MSFQLLLTIFAINEKDYRIKADTNLPDDASVKKVLKDALALMDTDPVEEENTATYTALSDPENVEMVEVKASSETDKEAGLYWPDPDARPTY